MKEEGFVLKHKTKKYKLLSLLVATVMVFGFIPMSVFAAENNVASMDGKEYTSVQAAVNEAKTDHKTIQLLSAVTEDITIPEGSNLTIDGQGNTLNGRIICDAQSDNQGTATHLTVTNLVMDGNNTSSMAIQSQNQSANQQMDLYLTVTNTTIQNYTSKGLYLTNAKVLTVDGCTFENNATKFSTYGGDYTIDLNLVAVQNANINITNTVFTGKCGLTAAIKVAQRGTEDGTGATDISGPSATVQNLNIQGCTFNAADLVLNRDIVLGVSTKSGNAENKSAAYPVNISDNKTDVTIKMPYIASGNAREVTVPQGETFTKDADTVNPVVYYVCFETNGGTVIDTQAVSPNGTAVQPQNPTKSGYVFEGWYTDETLNTVYQFDSEVTQNLTLYAKWLEGADYTKVNQAIEKANSLNRDDYEDFTAVDNAIAAVIPNLDISKQAEVDAMAQAIEDAIAGLQLKEPVVSGSYQITEGANSTWNKGNTNGLTVTSNGDFSKFIAVKVDGTEIAAENYTVESGSTIVTLNVAYLETLTEGTHTLTLVYTDGEVSTEFTVAPQTVAGTIEENTDTSASPQTGDSSNVAIWIVIAVLATGVMTGTVLFARKRKAE